MKLLREMTDRELLEDIYVMLQQVLIKVSEIDNDEKQFSMNLLADLVGTKLTGIQQ